MTFELPKKSKNFFLPKKCEVGTKVLSRAKGYGECSVPSGNPPPSQSAIVPTLITMARAPRKVANGISANFGSSNKARGNPRTTLAHKMPDRVVPHRVDAHADTAPTNTPGPPSPGDLDSASSIKLASLRIGPTED